jgi:Tat protein secretion system quality control protein TatD with DNase activity
VGKTVTSFQILVIHTLSDDFAAVLERAKAAGVINQIITGGSLKESKEALKLAKENGTHGSHTYKEYRV